MTSPQFFFFHGFVLEPHKTVLQTLGPMDVSILGKPKSYGANWGLQIEKPLQSVTGEHVYGLFIYFCSLQTVLIRTMERIPNIVHSDPCKSSKYSCLLEDREKRRNIHHWHFFPVRASLFFVLFCFICWTISVILFSSSPSAETKNCCPSFHLPCPHTRTRSSLRLRLQLCSDPV